MFRRFFTGESTEQVARPTSPAEDQETETVRRIVAKLESLPADQARLLASAAYVLARTANADLDITDEETRAMERLLVERVGIDEAQAVIVVEIAKMQARTVGGTEDYLVTREFRRLSTPEQRAGVLRAAFLIGAANGSISSEENAVINQIAEQFDLDADVVRAIRLEFQDQFAAVQYIHQLGSESEAAGAHDEG
jgi:uncharacterized tellurite resistance protein B-like protein